jgi:hypothetical protein
VVALPLKILTAMVSVIPLSANRYRLSVSRFGHSL